MNIYVGNLSRSTTEEETRKLFEPYGEVDSVDLITDRYSGEFRGLVSSGWATKEPERLSLRSI